MIFIIVVVFIVRGKVGFMSNECQYCDFYSREIEKLKQENKDMKEILKCIKNDHWFIINLIERYSSNKDLTLKDILERLIFRQPLFRRVFKDE